MAEEKNDEVQNKEEVQKEQESELSEEQLEGAAGGMSFRRTSLVQGSIVQKTLVESSDTDLVDNKVITFTQ